VDRGTISRSLIITSSQVSYAKNLSSPCGHDTNTKSEREIFHFVASITIVLENNWGVST
jgi:hypothetical protein